MVLPPKVASQIPTSELIPLSYVVGSDDGRRGHAGYSLAGAPCSRSIWMSFRWLTDQIIDGRILRLFKRGHNEEIVVLEDLQRIGCEIVSTQENYSGYKGHVGGSSDGILLGLRETDGRLTLLEIKTHSDKSFKDLVKNGLIKSKIQHYAQIQCYLSHSEADVAIYFAVNKNTDAIYTEIVEFDKTTAD